MNIEIRTATLDDHEAVSRIASELNLVHARALPHRFRVASDALPRDYFGSLVQSEDATVLVAERDRDVLGYAILQIKEAPPILVSMPRRYAFLNDLAVAEAEQGQGLGRLLVDAAVVWTRDQGASALELGVFEFNEAAIAFYEYLGFRTSKRTMALPVERA
jgi:ribosomal protein S18 acetylase RimI-like enzyme